MKTLIICLLLGVTLSVNLRFIDKGQLESHHVHQLDENNELHQKLLNASNIIRVHLIPHSHDDVGWLKTVDEYYFGQHNNIQWAGVQYIIDSYVDALSKDPNRKFIQVETAFFKRWWDEQNEPKRDQVRKLVKSGQLEFINGGWCMNDEATTYYEDIIDQMTLGHKFLYETFGVRPTIGWHIDPFGHQASQAAIFSQMGFDAWFFSRIDYQDKEFRLEKQSMEMIMHPIQQSKLDNKIFTHVEYYHYEAPPGFNFDQGRNTEPIIDNKNLKGYNLDNRARQFVEYFRNMSLHYKGNILMHTMGSDFEWTNSELTYKNIDKLINYINSKKSQFKMEFLYSTPSIYLAEINKQGESYPIKTDDFFPYADVEHGYWTGYFTSRVAIKHFTKWLGRFAQTVRKQVSVLFINGKSEYVNKHRDQLQSAVQSLDEALGILQHHDAVAGTEKQHVTNDYIETGYKAFNNINEHIKQIVAEFAYKETSEEIPQFEYCHWNETAHSCKTVYNALNNNNAVQVNLIDGKFGSSGSIEKLRIKVPRSTIKIVDEDNNVLGGDILCTNDLDEEDCDLHFLYPIKNRNSLRYFKILPTGGDTASAWVVDSKPVEDVNEDYEVAFEGQTKFRVHYGYYESYQGDGQKSGAYIFRPTGAANYTKPYGSIEKVEKFEGTITNVVKIRRTNTDTIIRYFKDIPDTFEIETFLREVPIHDSVGKEVVLLIETGIKNENVFYTDSNGLELQKRVNNYRETWKLKIHETSSGNYYPVNGVILIEDPLSGDAAALLNDRSQGGTSLRNGQIEVMIQRRILMDDSRGVGEPLNERNTDGTGLTQKIMHTLTFFNRKQNPNRHREIQFQNDLSPLAYFSETINLKFNPIVSLRATEDPLNELLSQNDDSNCQSLLKTYLQPWSKGTYLFRVHNMKEVGSNKLFRPKHVKMHETTLTGIYNWSEWQKKQLQWKEDIKQVEQEKHSKDEVLPLQIRTFLVSFDKEESNEYEE